MASGYALPQNGSHKHVHAQHSAHLHDHLDSARGPNDIHKEWDPTSHGQGQLPAHDMQGHAHDHTHSHGTIAEAARPIRPPDGSIGLSAPPNPTSLSRELSTGLLVPTTFFAAQWTQHQLHSSSKVPEHGGLLAEPSQASAIPWISAAYVTSAILLICGSVGRLHLGSSPLGARKASDASAIKVHTGGRLSLRDFLGASKTAAILFGLFCSSLFLDASRVPMVLLAGIATGAHASDVTWSKHLKSKAGFYLSVFALCLLDLLTANAEWQTTVLGYLVVIVSTVASPPVFLASAPVSPGLASSPTRPPFMATKATSTHTALAGLLLGLVTSIVGRLAGFTASSLLSAALSSMLAALACSRLALNGSSSFISRPKFGFVFGSFITLSAMLTATWPLSLSFLWSCTATLLLHAGVMYTTYTRHDDHSDGTHTHTHKKHHHANVSFLTSFLLARTTPGTLVYGILSEKDSRRIAYFTCLNFAFMLVQGFYGWVSGSLGLLSDTVHMFFDCLALIVGLGASVASKWPTSPEKPYGWSKLNTLAGFGNGVFLMLVSVEFVWGAIEGIMEGSELRHVEELLVVSTLGLIVNMIGLLAFGHAHAGHDHGGHGHGHAAHSDAQAHSHAHSHSHADAHSHDHGHDHDQHEHDQHLQQSHPHSHDDHHDHDHSHEKSHSHSHSHEKVNGHLHVHPHHAQQQDALIPPSALTPFATPLQSPMFHTPVQSPAHPPPRRQSLYPSTDPTLVLHSGHENDNMHGIYLHIAADAGGSLAVIISTTLTLWKPWYLWDPLATILIAVLIFMAAVPLVKDSARKLLMVIPEELEYELKNAMQELVMLRGVTGFAAPRFWVEDKEVDGGHGHHNHGHAHSHSHDHAHGEEAKTRLQGSIHVLVARTANVEDVRERVAHFFQEKSMDIFAQIEREGDRCWCGGETAGDRLH